MVGRSACLLHPFADDAPQSGKLGAGGFLRHPTRGWLSFDSEVLHDPERDQWVMLYTPRDGPAPYGPG